VPINYITPTTVADSRYVSAIIVATVTNNRTEIIEFTKRMMMDSGRECFESNLKSCFRAHENVQILRFALNRAKFFNYFLLLFQTILYDEIIVDIRVVVPRICKALINYRIRSLWM
jgi:hypothetical protein